MAKFIAYEWDDQSVRAISASLKGADIAIHALVEKQLEAATEDTATDTMLENAISAALESAGASRGQATAFSARRSQAEVRMLTFPKVPDHDLPDMVRIQAPQVFNAGTDGLLDFTPIGELQDGQRYIAAAALSNEMQVDTISSATVAGVTISNMALHPFGSASYVNKHLPSSDSRLIIDLLGVEAELTIARDGVAHLVRTIRLVADAPDVNYIASEVKRTLTSYENQPNGSDVTEIIVAGTGTVQQSLLETLKPILSEPVRLFDPLEFASLDASIQNNMPENPAAFLGLIGLAEQLTAGVTPPIDFLNPTQPPKQTETRDKAVRTGVYATVALVVLIIALWVPIFNYQRGISEKRPAAELRTALQKQLDQVDSQLKAIQAYEASAVNWLDELALLSDTLPPNPNDVIIDGFSGRSDNSRSRTVDSPLGSIFLDMHLKNSSVFEQLSTTLDGGTHLVESKGLTPDTTEDGQYTRRTQQTITILPPNEQEANADSSDTESTDADSTGTDAKEGSSSTNSSDKVGEAEIEQVSASNDKDGE